MSEKRVERRARKRAQGDVLGSFKNTIATVCFSKVFEQGDYVGIQHYP